jgi:hypothetical protein
VATAGRTDQTQLPWTQAAGLSATSLSVTVLFLNLVDALLTLLFLQLKVAYEVNPLMRLAYHGSPVGFILIKIGLVQLSLLILCSNYRIRLARYALVCAAGLYIVIVAYELAFLARLWMG